MMPTQLESRNMIDGRISISFRDYTTAPQARQTAYNQHDEEVTSDEEEIRSHIIAALFCEFDVEEDEDDDPFSIIQGLASLNSDNEGNLLPYPQHSVPKLSKPIWDDSEEEWYQSHSDEEWLAQPFLCLGKQ